jgi:two-component system KDP operon response regulator KdpE
MTQRGARILVVDDEPAILRAVRTNLDRHDFDVETAETGAAALSAYRARRPDIILLDLGLPDMDGSAVLRAVREDSTVPVIVLSVREAEREKVEALDLGADDYITKPFGVDELLARIRVALRHAARPSAGTDAIARVGGIEMNFERREVVADGREVRLTPTEYDLLKAFMNHPDKVLTDQMLLSQVWGPGYGEEAHYLHVYVARLRKKLEADPQRPRYLRTEPGVGYRLLSEPAY